MRRLVCRTPTAAITGEEEAIGRGRRITVITAEATEVGTIRAEVLVATEDSIEELVPTGEEDSTTSLKTEHREVESPSDYCDHLSF